MKTDREVLRSAVTQLLIADLTERHGWREGVSFHTGLPKMESDMAAGEQLLARGVMTRGACGGLLHLSESAVVQALHVAVDAAVADLLEYNPPPATFADDLERQERYDGRDDLCLSLGGIESDEPGVRSWS